MELKRGYVLLVLTLTTSGVFSAYSRNREQATIDDSDPIGIGDIFSESAGATLEVIDSGSLYSAKMMKAAYEINRKEALRADWERKKAETQDYTFGPVTFDCVIQTSPQVPTSVHALRPSDVNVLIAMGDSITAGFGVGSKNFIEVFRGQRGESWSIGGDRTLDMGVITLTNIMRKFNPEVKGYSECIGAKNSERAWLNVALGGAVNLNMPSQADDILRICTNDPRIDVNNDWKIVTLFIGGNDLCRVCQYEQFNATNYVTNIAEALDRLHAALPRTLVNLVPMFDITPLANFSTGPLCNLIQPLFCPCGILPQHRPNSRSIQYAYYEGLRDLVESGRYDTRQDFTVVLQTMFVDLTPPIDPDTGKYDKTFLSYDCFHPSRKAHQMFAYMLWNTMLIKYGEKPLTWDHYEEDPKYYCPTEEHPYIFTSQNSG